MSLNPLSLFRAMPGSIAQGMIWGVMALGVYITFRLLDFADLTVDGSIATGAAVSVMLIRAGVSPIATLPIAFLAGALAGMVTGLLNTALGIPGILASILTQISLYSINLNIMGKANQPVSVDNYPLVVSLRYVTDGSVSRLLFFLGMIVFLLALIAVMYWYFGTEQGHAIRATGCNSNMARAQGINTNFIKVLALMISNGLVGLCGALYGQFQGASDVNMGRGAIVIGLAAVIIGEVLFGKFASKRKLAFAFTLASVILGAVIYYMVYQFVLWLKMPSEDMKLFSAIVVAIFLAIPYLKEKRTLSERSVKIMAYALEIQDIHKVFNRGTINEKVALNGVNLNLNPGDFVTIIGGNGAGKSTTLNAIAGVWPIDSGKIIIDGTDITSLPEHKRAKYLGRVFQDPMTGTAATMDIEENMAIALRRGEKRTLRWGVSREDRELFREKLQTLGLGLEDRMTSKVGLLSGGQRQAITLLMAALKQPKLLLLDEHTAALDPKTAAKVLEISDKIIAENQLTAMMVTHNMKDAIVHGNRLIMMHEGKVIYDVAGEEKKNLQVKDLLAKFEEVSGGEFANDRMMLA